MDSEILSVLIETFSNNDRLALIVIIILMLTDRYSVAREKKRLNWAEYQKRIEKTMQESSEAHEQTMVNYKLLIGMQSRIKDLKIQMATCQCKIPPPHENISIVD